MMDEKKMQELLGKVSCGTCTVAEAMAELKNFPAEMLLCAHLDHHRRLRTGIPEVVYGENKTAGQDKNAPHGQGDGLGGREDYQAAESQGMENP